MGRKGSTIYEFEHPDGKGQPVQLAISNEQMELARSTPESQEQKAKVRKVQSFISLRFNMQVKPKPRQAVQWQWLVNHMTQLGPERRNSMNQSSDKAE